jgi:hypothetical protein
MFHEYAVEPQVIGSSWQTCRYVIEKFGFDKGRLISEFPKSWLREVYDATLNLPDVEKKRVVEALTLAKQKLIRSGRPFNPASGDWLYNALTEHARLPFKGIIARQNSAKSSDVLIAEDLDERSPQMIVATSLAISRDAVSIATALSGFIVHGSRIVFVDPYFDLFNQKYKNTLKQCLLLAKARNPTADIEIHYKYHDKKVEPSHIEKSVTSALGGLIPSGMEIKVFCWAQKDGGEDFHARYLLTERGGIGVDAGFSAEGNHETTDMHILGLEFCKERLATFTRPANVYELIGPVLSVDANGRVTHI